MHRSNLQDGPNNPWPPALLGRLIGEAVEHHGIDEVRLYEINHDVRGHLHSAPNSQPSEQTEYPHTNRL